MSGFIKGNKPNLVKEIMIQNLPFVFTRFIFVWYKNFFDLKHKHDKYANSHSWDVIYQRFVDFHENAKGDFPRSYATRRIVDEIQ